MALLDDIISQYNDQGTGRIPEQKKVAPAAGPEEKDDKDVPGVFSDNDPEMPPKGLKHDTEPGKIIVCDAFMKEFGDRI